MSGAGQWVFLNAGTWWVAAVAAVAALALFLGHLRPGGDPRAARASARVRVLAILALAMAVLRPARETELVRAKRPPLAVVVDDSKSMALSTPSLAAGATQWLSESEDELKALDEVFRVERWNADVPPRPPPGIGAAPIVGIHAPRLPARPVAGGDRAASPGPFRHRASERRA